MELLHVHFIEEYDAESTVNNLVRLLFEKLDNLQLMPNAWPLVKEDHLATKWYRSFLAKNYLVFYKIFEDEKIVRMYRFLHSSRDWVSILKEDLEDENI